MKKSLITFIALFLCTYIYAQEESWERHTFATGYISLEGEYLSGVDKDHIEHNFGIGIGEAGLLLSIKPLKQLEVKSTFIYRPNYSLDNTITELFAFPSYPDIYCSLFSWVVRQQQ